MVPIRVSRTLALAAVCGSSAVSAQVAPRAAAAIDSFFTATMRARRIPGAGVAVVENGNVVYEKAFGVANLETQTPLAVHSVFELASLTKEFTAGAIMLLVEDGTVKLDAPITTYIDSGPPAWTRITVRHLLTHTSGLFAGGIVFQQGSPLLNITTRQAFASVSAARPFPPGDVAVCSDGGYFLAVLLRSFAGMPRSAPSGDEFGDEIRHGRRRDEVFERLGATIRAGDLDD